METKTPPMSKVAALREEMNAIHFANAQYWERGDAATLEERAEHERRKDRLEEIRRELAELQAS
jgi:hypothetical protein